MDSWFHSWNPPSSLDHHFNVSSTSTIYGSNWSLNQSHPGNFLPVLFSLSLVNPEEHQETTGPFKTIYQWKQLDYAYPSKYDREYAIVSGAFIPKNCLPLGIEVYQDRLFVAMPKWKKGVPATLAVLPKIPKKKSPKLVPYPNWDWHTTESCDGIVSVFRMSADACGRLWVLDSGQVQITAKPQQVCPVKLLIFDLATDKLYRRYIFPKHFIKQDSLYSNILVDMRGNDCTNVHAYLTDVWRYGLVVYSLERHTAWRVTDHLFFPEPLAAAYEVHDLKFEWTDGIFGMALSPVDEFWNDRILYFHPMSSFREFSVKTSVICNETGWDKVKDAFQVLGQSRGKSGHVSASAMDRRGVMFYNLVTRDSIGCWDTRKAYKRSNLGVIAKNNETLVFPNDMKIDQEEKQSVWIITNKLPFYIYGGLKEDEINFRIMSADVEKATKGTICDPSVSDYGSYEEYNDDEDCY